MHKRHSTKEEAALEGVFWRLVGENMSAGDIGKHPDYRKAIDDCYNAGIELWPGWRDGYVGPSN